MKTKVCPNCKVEKAGSEFINSKGNRVVYCKECTRENNRKVKYTDFNKTYSKINPTGKAYFKACWTCGKIYPIDHYKKGSWACKKCQMVKDRKQSKCKTCRIEIKSKVYFKTCTTCKKIHPVNQVNKYKLCYTCQKLKDTKDHSSCIINPIGKQYFKACSVCKTVKTLDEYYNSGNGKISECIVCKKESTKNSIDNLDDKYIKIRIQRNTGLSTLEIPEGFIEIQRLIMTAKRELKQHTTA